MKLKPGVRILGVKPEIVVAMQVADSVYHLVADVEMVITSVVDGAHRRGSIHYQGLAFDSRISNVSDPARIRDRIDEALGKDFDVTLEADHIHVEFQPKEAL